MHIDHLPSPSPARPMPDAVFVIPCCGHAHELAGAVASVLAQSHAAWECVIVDDGSPDHTAAAAEALMARHADRDIRLIRQANAGVAAARNAGVRASRAEIIIPLDADDRVEPSYLARVLAAFAQAPHAELVFTDLAVFGGSEGVVAYAPLAPAALTRSNDLPMTTAFTRGLWARTLGYDDGMRDGYEDWNFWLSCVEAGAQSVHIAEPLCRYRSSATGLCSRAQTRDAWLKARIIAGHPRSFAQPQLRWAAEVLTRSARGETSPIHEGLSFAEPGLLPNCGEAHADLGVLACERGDIQSALSQFLLALRGPDLRAPQRTALYQFAVGLGLKEALHERARAEAEA
jgi:glycosyltransferase involved in cell wall biosynthesis